jgi:integrase
MRKRIPTGSVFQKTYPDRRGRNRKTATFYVKYYVNGRFVELSSGTSDYDEAVTMLRQKMAGAARGGEHTRHPERVRLNQLFDLLMDDYRYKSRKSTYCTEHRIDCHLRPFFGETKAIDLSTSKLRQYVAHRRKEGGAAATINKELSFIRRAMNIGAKHEPPLVLRVPAFEMLAVDNARQGTLDHEAYKRVRDALPPYARIALVIGYHTGARAGEICSIRKEWINLAAKRINLPGRVTKNGRARYLPIYGDMGPELDVALAATKDSDCPLLVQRGGAATRDWRKTWEAACDAAGVPDTLFHDLRRTAVTNMIEAGLSEKEAMEISGHKTRAVFDRYHIVSERRMKLNAAKLEEHLKAKDAEAPVQVAGASRNSLVC